MTDPIPLEDLVVNERFWLKYARTAVEGAAKARVATADKLVTGAGWLWTVYTAVALVGAAFSENALSTGRAVLVFLPVPLLALAYLAALYSAAAIDGTYDPTVPDDVRHAYLRSAGKRKGRIERAAAVLVIGAAGVVVAGIAVATSPSTEDEVPTLHVAWSRSGDSLVVEVIAAAGAPVVLDAENSAGDVLATELVTTGEDGRASTSLAVDGHGGEAQVTASWTTEDARYVLSTAVPTLEE